MKLVKHMKVGERGWIEVGALFTGGQVPNRFWLLAEATVVAEKTDGYTLPVSRVSGGFWVGELGAGEEVVRVDDVNWAEQYQVLGFAAFSQLVQEAAEAVIASRYISNLADGEVGYVSPKAIYTTGNQPAVFYVRGSALVAQKPNTRFCVAVRRRYDDFVCSKLGKNAYAIDERDDFDTPVLRFEHFDVVVKGSSLPNLFVSFTGVLYALKNGRVTEADLQKGLFIFGCTRDHAINPGAHEEYVEGVVKERPDIHQLLVKALLRAEADGRVNWRGGAESNVTFEMVDDLLVRKGYRPLMGEREALYDRPLDRWNYSYPGVARRSTQLDVIM